MIERAIPLRYRWQIAQNRRTASGIGPTNIFAPVARHGFVEVEFAIAGWPPRLPPDFQWLRVDERTRLAVPRAGTSVTSVKASEADADDESTATGGRWGDPIPLGPPPPPQLPLEGLRPWLRDFTQAVAAHTATPPDMALLLGLTAISVALANKAVVIVKPGYSEPLMIWTASVAPPGSRKSAVFRLMMEPIHGYEAEEKKRYRAELGETVEEREIFEEALKKAKADATRALRTRDGYEHAKKEVAELRERLDSMRVREPDQITIQNVTAERLGQLMGEHFGRAAIVSSEGDIFSIMAGLYGDGSPHFEVFKKGWTGNEAISDERIMRQGTRVARPALVMGVTIQPIVLASLKHRDHFRGEGLLGRFLFAQPDMRIGYRPTGEDLPPLDESAQERYARALRTLIHSTPSQEDREDWIAHELRLSSEAVGLKNAFEAEVEHDLRPGEKLDGVEDWGGKIVGNVIRLAGLIHVAQQVEKRQGLWETAVSSDAMETAIRLGKALILHALYVFDGMDDLAETRDARYVLERIVTYEGDEPLTERELHRRCGRTEFRYVEGLKQPLALLAKHHFIRLDQRDSTGGRRPSPLIQVNPKVLGQRDKSDRSSTQESVEEAWNAQASQRRGRPRTRRAGSPPRGKK